MSDKQAGVAGRARTALVFEKLLHAMAGAVVAISIATGCAPARRTVPTTKPEPNPAPDVAAQVAVRVRELSRLAEDYESLSRQLPGRTPSEHRELVRKVFAQLSQILPMLHGPQTDLIFRQQMMILENSRAQLATASADLAIEPTIDTGLRAAYNALAGIGRTSYYERSDLSGPFDQMLGKVNELDATHGLSHQVIVGEAIEFSSELISKMVDVLGQRLVAEPTTEPTTEPSTAPSSEPSTAPSTESSTEPSTEPASTRPASSVPTSTPAAATAPATGAPELNK